MLAETCNSEPFMLDTVARWRDGIKKRSKMAKHPEGRVGGSSGAFVALAMICCDKAVADIPRYTAK